MSKATSPWISEELFASLSSGVAKLNGIAQDFSQVMSENLNTLYENSRVRMMKQRNVFQPQSSSGKSNHIQTKLYRQIHEAQHALLKHKGSLILQVASLGSDPTLP